MIHFEKVSFEQYYKDRTKVETYLTEEEVRSEYDAIKLPKRATTDSAGYDFFAPYTFDLIGTHSDKAEEKRGRLDVQKRRLRSKDRGTLTSHCRVIRCIGL